MSAKTVGMLALAALCGFVGGLVSQWTERLSTPTSLQVVRAVRFELVGPDGKPLAYWGGSEKGIVLAFTGMGKNELAALGLQPGGRSPFVELAGYDGKPRAVLELGDGDKPVLEMSDAGYEGRVILGATATDAPSPLNDSWALRFRSPEREDLAAIGMFGDRGKLSGTLYANKKGRIWSAP